MSQRLFCVLKLPGMGKSINSLGGGGGTITGLIWQKLIHIYIHEGGTSNSFVIPTSTPTPFFTPLFFFTPSVIVINVFVTDIFY